MKLRTGKPIWFSYPVQRLREQKLSSSVGCDVAIIGAGITGALVAHRLLLAGLRVVMVDKRRAGFGSTAASTGLLLIQPDTSIAELERIHGTHTAQRVYQLGHQAIRDLRVLVRRLKIDCGWETKRTLYCASSPKDTELLRKEAARTKRIGFATERLSAERIRERYHLDFPAALLAAGAAEVSALQLTRGVLSYAQRNPNFRLFQQTRVTALGEDSAKTILRTDRGAEIYARHVIIAAGYESRQFVRSKLVRLRSTYVIASKPFSPAQLRPLRCLMWETARPYFYLRTTPDHRIIFGGADEPFDTDSGRERKRQRKTRELEEFFATLFPSLAFRADYAWSGTFAETTDGLPCIGPKEPDSRVFNALGYGGNGITFSQIAARLLCDACLGEPNPDAELFAFDRTATKRARRF
jgi:glycine/D-amino acid oxidase-like deaminating enzyme